MRSKLVLSLSLAAAGLVFTSLMVGQGFKLSESGTTRGPASLPQKQLLVASKLQTALKYTHKTRGPIETKIEIVGNPAAVAGDYFQVRGLVYSPETLENVNFEWALPPDVELVRGNIKGHMARIDGSQASYVELILKSTTGANHMIHFVAGASKGGIRFADSTQYNTLLQAALEESDKMLQKSSEALLEQQQQQQLKVFQ